MHLSRDVIFEELECLKFEKQHYERGFSPTLTQKKVMYESEKLSREEEVNLIFGIEDLGNVD